MESGLPDWPPPWNGFFHFFSEPSLRLLLFIFNDEMKVQNYLVDISTPKTHKHVSDKAWIIANDLLVKMKEQVELDLLTPFSKIRDGRAGSVWLYDYMPELKKDIISVLPTIMQESSFWWEYCSEYWRNCSLSLWMETSQRQELGQTLSLRTVLKTWSVKNQKTSRSFFKRLSFIC